MTAPTPKTKADLVLEEINAVVTSVARYLDPEDWTVKKLMRTAQDLIRSAPAPAHSAKAAVFQLTGDVANVLYHDDNAIQLAPGEPIFDMNKCSHLSNLGFFSKAQAPFARAADPE